LRWIPSAGARYPSRGAAIVWSIDAVRWSNPRPLPPHYIVHPKMKRCAAILLPALAILSVAISYASLVRAQQDPTLDARRRRFPDVGAGFRAIRRDPDGSYYVLAPSTPSRPSKPSAPAVLIFDSQGRKLRQIPARPGPGEIVFPNSLDLDASGRIYIADLGGNAVNVYTADGALFAHFRVPAPTQIIALPHDQFAVCSSNADHLIAVYDLHGMLLREFGALADLSDDADLNHRLNLGHLASDKAGNLYFAFRYLPEPTVRKYDPSSGHLLDELSLMSLDLQPIAQSARQEIARSASGKAISPHEIISALGVDPETQELWLALGNLFLHFDNADNNTASNRAYTPGGARMVPNFILVEKDDLLLGNDPLGIYEFPRSSGKVRRPE